MKNHTRTINYHSMTAQDRENVYFGRPVCYVNNQCDEATCREFQKEHKDSENICYLEE